jgi:hypothetical protein
MPESVWYASPPKVSQPRQRVARKTGLSHARWHNPRFGADIGRKQKACSAGRVRLEIVHHAQEELIKRMSARAANETINEQHYGR